MPSKLPLPESQTQYFSFSLKSSCRMLEKKCVGFMGLTLNLYSRAFRKLPMCALMLNSSSKLRKACVISHDETRHRTENISNMQLLQQKREYDSSKSCLMPRILEQRANRNL